jgi:hypothetical protein
VRRPVVSPKGDFRNRRIIIAQLGDRALLQAPPQFIRVVKRDCAFREKGKGRAFPAIAVRTKAHQPILIAKRIRAVSHVKLVLHQAHGNARECTVERRHAGCGRWRGCGALGNFGDTSDSRLVGKRVTRRHGGNTVGSTGKWENQVLLKAGGGADGTGQNFECIPFHSKHKFGRSPLVVTKQDGFAFGQNELFRPDKTQVVCIHGFQSEQHGFGRVDACVSDAGELRDIEDESVHNSSQIKGLEKIRTQIMIIIWRKTPQMTVQWLAELGFEVMSKQGLGDLL